MVVEVTDKAGQQVGATQEGAVLRGNAAQDNVVAAAGAGVAAIQEEFFRAEPGLVGLFIEFLGGALQITPGRGRRQPRCFGLAWPRIRWVRA